MATSKASKSTKTPPAPPPVVAMPRLGVSEVLDLVADALVERLVPRLAARSSTVDDIVDQLSAPCERRRYLEAARRGAFPSHRHGKRVFARRADVLAWLTSGTSHAKGNAAPVPSLAPVGGYNAVEDDVRRSLGLRTKGAA